MMCVESLPDGYNEIYSVDLQKNMKTALFLNVLCVVIALFLAVPVCFVVPITTLFSMRFAVMLVLIILYVILHELVHGIAMKICGTKKVKYGFTGIYAFAGSSDYYDKRAYIFIALAPVVLWGIVLAVVNMFVPIEWFWVVYSIQIFNLSGAAGDYFVTAKFCRMPKDILIQDYGVGMKVFSKE